MELQLYLQLVGSIFCIWLEYLNIWYPGIPLHDHSTKWTKSLWNPSEATGVMVSTFWFFVQRGFGNCPIQIATISVIICNYHCDTLWQLNIDVKIKMVILEKNRYIHPIISYLSITFWGYPYYISVVALFSPPWTRTGPRFLKTEERPLEWSQAEPGHGSDDWGRDPKRFWRP